MWYLKLPPLIYSPSSVRGNCSSEDACVSFLPCLTISSVFLRMCVCICDCCSVTQLCLTLQTWTAACQASLSFTISQSLIKLMSIESVMPSNYLILYCPLLLLPSIFPSIRVLPSMSHLVTSGGQTIGASASTSVLLMNIQDWLLLESTGLISLQSKGLSRVFSNTIVQKHQFFGIQPSLCSNSHIHTWLLEKP